ncbi:MAG: hypothetical protein M3T96_01900 [Acidobacteriota bacterium]|nr:hypothetical protein [Acidobacteriota bacterium]
MTAIENFTLENLPGKIWKPDLFDRFFNLFNRRQTTVWQADSTRSEVLFDGTRSETSVDGTELKAQFKHRSGYVLFTANDCCETEEIFISFLDFDCKPLDNLMLDGLFSSLGFAFGFKIISADAIEFSIYQEEKKRRLKIISPPAAEFPVNCAALTARSVKRHFSKHYLKLEIEII